MLTPVAVAPSGSTTLNFSSFPSVEVSNQAVYSPAGKWVAFVGRGFSDEKSASEFGRRFAHALLVTGAIAQTGVDIGFDRETTQFSKTVADAVRSGSGKELRGEVHGLMTYEEGTVTIAGLTASLSTSTSKDTLEASLENRLATAKPLTERQINCAALLNDSLFTANVEGQLVLRVSAVEALCDRTDVGPDYPRVIDVLAARLAELQDSAEKDTAQRMLSFARSQSIRQSYMRKITSLLSAHEARSFDELYRKRSTFVHDGRGRGELAGAAQASLDLAVALLRAELGVVS